MGKPDILQFINFDELTEAQRKDLTKRLKERRDQLQKAMGLMDKALVKLAKKPKGK